jgi:hypothetical protein
MIRYAVSEADIAREIDQRNATWRDRARALTESFVNAQGYSEHSSIWSEVKPVYMALQNSKCVFCERKFETEEYGKIEFDLEHFRPKSSVIAWPPARSRVRFDFATGEAVEKGYYWLAYDLLNYAASCKVCNSKLKANYFPIAGARGVATTSPAELAIEKPFLCYPISDLDDDPQQLLTFRAIFAIPASSDLGPRRRAEVMIEFFRLNKRQHLLNERARMIMILGQALDELSRGVDLELNREIVNKSTSEAVPHTGCCRAFLALWQSDEDLARIYFRKCRQYYAGLIGAEDILI